MNMQKTKNWLHILSIIGFLLSTLMFFETIRTWNWIGNMSLLLIVFFAVLNISVDMRFTKWIGQHS